MQSESESVHIIVDYAREAALDVWLPSSMMETYSITERVGPALSVTRDGPAGIATRAYECRASYSNARFTPILMQGTK
jgi:hypothetical protein